MDAQITTHIITPMSLPVRPAAPTELLALILIWSVDHPERVGEVVMPPESGRVVFGRGMGSPGALPRVEPIRQRPGVVELPGPMLTPTLSREQLELEQQPEGLSFRNVGRCICLVNGNPTADGVLVPGDVLELEGRAAFYCGRRPPELPAPPPDTPLLLHPFGEADAVGVVGESPAAWNLRRQLVFLARRTSHVLILGESGTGKEVAAHAIHRLSKRAGKAMVSRNAATIPESLVDAELFGNAKNYPNPGMPERAGLIGEAHGSTLFLDEFGELPQELQAHLLRVLDLGEYQRLGEATQRRADFRLLAATNRAPETLKHDILARLKLRLIIPNLNQRREDIPLLARHLLHRIAKEDPEIGHRFLVARHGRREISLSSRLVLYLVTFPYHTHIRELESLLWQAISASDDGLLDLPAGLEPMFGVELPLSETALRLSASGEAEKAGADATLEVNTPAPLYTRLTSGTPTHATAPFNETPPKPTRAEQLSFRDASEGIPAIHHDVSAEAFERALGPQERARLMLFRRYRFNLTAACRDPELPISRSSADLQLRLLTFKALMVAQWQVPLASHWLTEGEESLQLRMEARLHTTLKNLDARLKRDGEEALRARLAAEYGQQVVRVLPALEALIRGWYVVEPTEEA